MINIVVGKPGMGKTYYLVKIAWHFIKKGVDVHSNFYINFDKLIAKDKLRHPKRVYGQIIFWEKLDELIDIRGGIILIDECQIYFNSRQWKNLPPKLQYKFQQHRKHIGKNGQGLDIWGAVQNVKRIDTVVRELVNTVHYCKKFGPFFRVSKFDIEEIDNVTKKSKGTKIFFLDKSIANSYDTYQEIGGFSPA